MNLTTQHRNWLFMAAAIVLLTICVVIYSEESFDAAVAGLKIWWDVVFPALLPFFILAELMMGLGVVHALGALLEPLMRPLFRVPGVGAFAFAMGLASGYPIGARITGELRRKQMCTRIEGERLLTFTNTADPLFMIGAVAVGMFKNPAIGLAIAGAHYVSSILLGLLMRFYGRKEERANQIPLDEDREKNIFVKAIEDLLDARTRDGRGFGQLLGDAIKESVTTLLVIGGFIILFSVITRILTCIGIVQILTRMIMFLLAPLGISEAMVMPIIGGLFEITNGANLAATAVAPLFQRVAICSAIIAWSGFSVHAQVATMVQGTDIRIGIYIIARMLHAVIAALCTFFFLSPATTVLAPVHLPGLFAEFSTLGIFERFGYFSTHIAHNFLLIFAAMFFLSLAIALIRRVRIIVLHYRG